MADPGMPEAHKKLTWRGGLFLVGPDPLTSLFYASGLLIAAGVGYATPLFVIGLYALLFLLAPIYVEAVLMTLSNGGTYNMVRTALQKMPVRAMGVAAVVGIITSVSYVATAIVSQLSFGHYVMALSSWAGGFRVPTGVLCSAVPSLVFGLWVMWSERWMVLRTVLVTTLAALALSPLLPSTVVALMNPVILLYTLNNRGLRESVRVSTVIFFLHLAVMAVFILSGTAYIVRQHIDLTLFLHGSDSLPGIDGLTLALVIAGVGNAILGASGVESVMQIPEELDDPRRGIPKIYAWMLSILLVFGGLVTLVIFFVLGPAELQEGRHFLVSMAGRKVMASITGSPGAGQVFETVIVIDAALTLIGATNTSFAGIRGLWVTMAKDHLLPRLFLRVDRRTETHRNIHTVFLVAIAFFALSTGANLAVLGHWYGGTFGLVMFSGVIGIVLLRHFQPNAPRPYRAPLDITIRGTKIPFAAVAGFVVVGGALVSLHVSARPDVEQLRQLLTYLFVLVAIVIAYYAHPAWIRSWSHYRQEILLEHRGGLHLEQERAVAVCVGGYRARERVLFMLEYAAMNQYPHLIVLHVSGSVDAVMVLDPYDTATRYLDIPGLHSRRILETLTATIPQVEEVALHVVLIPLQSHERWQDAVRDFLRETPEIHFVATGPGEALDDVPARVLVIRAD